jgi:hypothetical protein
MSLNKGKHTVTEIEGVRCSVVETGVSEARMTFLKELLENNGYTVKCEKEKAKDGSPLETFILGVTDILFNPVIRVYQHKILRKDGKEVTPAYLNQWTADPGLPYWQVNL